MPDGGGKTNAEWAASLTVPEIEAIIHSCLRERDWPGLETAVKLLTSRDPERAHTLVEAMRLGVALAQMSDDQREQAAQEAKTLGLIIGGKTDG